MVQKVRRADLMVSTSGEKRNRWIGGRGEAPRGKRYLLSAIHSNPQPFGFNKLAKNTPKSSLGLI